MTCPGMSALRKGLLATRNFSSCQAAQTALSQELSLTYGLCSAEDLIIEGHGKGVVKTDLSIAIPSGTYARVAPRSGLAVKHFIDTGAGVVDEDYRGNVGVVLFNHGPDSFAGGPCTRNGTGQLVPSLALQEAALTVLLLASTGAYSRPVSVTLVCCLEQS